MSEGELSSERHKGVAVPGPFRTRCWGLRKKRSLRNPLNPPPGGGAGLALCWGRAGMGESLPHSWDLFNDAPLWVPQQEAAL